MDTGDDAHERRWDELVADLEGQADAHEAVEDRAQAADHLRSARADVTLGDRLRAAMGTSADSGLVLAVRGAGPVRGAVVAVGPSWVALDDGVRETVVLLAAVLSVTGLPRGAAPPGSLVEQRRGLGQVLRRYATDRASVRVVLDTGDVLAGTIDVVAADHLELAEHAPGEARRVGAVTALRVVPFAALAAVSRGGARSPR